MKTKNKKTTTTIKSKLAKNAEEKLNADVEDNAIKSISHGYVDNVAAAGASKNVVDDVKRRKELSKLSPAALVEMVIAKEDVIRTLERLIDDLSTKISKQPVITFPPARDSNPEPIPHIAPYETPSIPSKPWWEDPNRVIMCGYGMVRTTTSTKEC